LGTVRDTSQNLLTPFTGAAMLRILDPSTGDLLAEIEESADAAVLAAVGAARTAFVTWRETPAGERGMALRRVATSIKADEERLAELNARETGKVIGDARGGVAAAIATIEQYAELGPLHRGKSLNGDWSATDLMVNEPRGVVAVITPWNDPVAVSAGLLAAALVTGNTVVYKPSERAPQVGAALAAHFTPSEGRAPVRRDTATFRKVRPAVSVRRVFPPQR
jgi:acyl-CoA reductase-like NAD-dependent aldehyde dehydrogenase